MISKDGTESPELGVTPKLKKVKIQIYVQKPVSFRMKMKNSKLQNVDGQYHISKIS